MIVIKSMDELRDSIATLLEYNWKGEERDFAENPDDCHIFQHMVALDNFIQGQEETPESYVKDNLGIDLETEDDEDA